VQQLVAQFAGLVPAMAIVWTPIKCCSATGDTAVMPMERNPLSAVIGLTEKN
jgi:hypothetical protein